MALRTNLTPNEEYLKELKEMADENPEFLDEVVKFEDQYMTVREALRQSSLGEMTSFSPRTKQSGGIS